eukprot:10259-Heterococcus_DN1.PRE.1
MDRGYITRMPVQYTGWFVMPDRPFGNENTIPNPTDGMIPDYDGMKLKVLTMGLETLFKPNISCLLIREHVACSKLPAKLVQHVFNGVAAAGSTVSAAELVAKPSSKRSSRGRYAFLLLVLINVVSVVDDIQYTRKRQWWPMSDLVQLLAAVKVVGESAALVLSTLLFIIGCLLNWKEIDFWASSIGTPASVFSSALIKKAVGETATEVHMLNRVFVVASLEVTIVIGLLLYYNYTVVLPKGWFSAVLIALAEILWLCAALVHLCRCSQRTCIEFSFASTVRAFNIGPQNYQLMFSLENDSAGPGDDELEIVRHCMVFGPMLFLKGAEFYYTLSGVTPPESWLKFVLQSLVWAPALVFCTVAALLMLAYIVYCVVYVGVTAVKEVYAGVTAVIHHRQDRTTGATASLIV